MDRSQTEQERKNWNGNKPKRKWNRPKGTERNEKERNELKRNRRLETKYFSNKQTLFFPYYPYLLLLNFVDLFSMTTPNRPYNLLFSLLVTVCPKLRPFFINITNCNFVFKKLPKMADHLRQ